MGEQMLLKKRHYTKGYNEENSKDEESNQFWERLVDITGIPETKPRELDRHPNYK